MRLIRNLQLVLLVGVFALLLNPAAARGQELQLSLDPGPAGKTVSPLELELASIESTVAEIRRARDGARADEAPIGPLRSATIRDDGTDPAVAISTPLSLSEFSSARLSLVARRTDDTGSTAWVEFLDRDQHWDKLGAIAPESSRQSWPIPQAGLHAGFRARVRVGEGGAWVFRDLRVEARCLVLIESAKDVALRVAADEKPAETVTGIRVFDLPYGTRLRIETPLRTPAQVFTAWSAVGIGDGAARLEEPSISFVVERNTRLRGAYAALGDMNGDGVADKLDVDVFVLALLDPAEYQRRFPGLNAVRRGDANGDGVLTNRDIEPFVDALLEPPPK